MDSFLDEIIVRLPQAHHSFITGLFSILGVLGRNESHLFKLDNSNPDYFPSIIIDLESHHSDVCVDFIKSTGECLSVVIENTTGLDKQSPHSYQPLSVTTIKRRFEDFNTRLLGVDHVGFNLPWFASPIHPTIFKLRHLLSEQCLYHCFPTGESWDFILPGDLDEITRRKPVDYTEIRRPKFELVSFEKASKPLIQFDVSAQIAYEQCLHLFPESLPDPSLRNVWLYLENPYQVDVCLVINEFEADSDWSTFFAGCRL